jgi:flagellar basal-body rod protein FlgF
MTEGEVKGANMDPGTITPTGRPLDVALQGSALLAVQAGWQRSLHPPRRSCHLAHRRAENGDGRPVVGNGGPITVPLDAKVAIGPMVRCW